MECKCSVLTLCKENYPNRITRFLLARLYVDSLLDKRNRQKVMVTLNKLSEGSRKLDEAYDEAVIRIDGQLEEDRLLAKRALCWISFAQRPLTTTELRHALATDPGDRALNNDKLYEVEYIVSVCAGLVTVDEGSNIIRLVHYTTQEYFERVRLCWNPSAQEVIAETCLTYLSFDIFRSSSCANDEAFEQRLAENDFFDYSARYWSEHIRPVQHYTTNLALAFLLCNDLVQCTSQCALIPDYRYRGYSQEFPGQTSGLHLTARYGLLHLTGKLLEDSNFGFDVDSRDSYGQTPLWPAAGNGHEGVVKLLLEAKADVEAHVLYRETALGPAAGNGHEGVVKLLLEAKADVEAHVLY
jgi:hypothetical protein